MVLDLGRMFGFDGAGHDNNRWLAHGAREASRVPDAWERRIVELSDGRPVAEIIEILYLEEVKAGAWAADIGLWKRIFDRSVVGTIGALATKGDIRLEPINGA